MAKARNRANELRATFEAAGAVVVEPPVLQPAETLLDLYGEDIRARAYITSDALRGEQMLRPDFTVPVVQMHMAHGAEPAIPTQAKCFAAKKKIPIVPVNTCKLGMKCLTAPTQLRQTLKFSQ
jgi:histidyl-tRNA synthetase